MMSDDEEVERGESAACAVRDGNNDDCRRVLPLLEDDDVGRARDHAFISAVSASHA